MIIIDTETTGLNPVIDNLLQVSIIDENGETLFNSYVKPDCSEWPEAMAVNNIKPEMVADAPKFEELRESVQEIIDHAECIAGYNTYFDIAFLRENGIYFRNGLDVIDVMTQFAEIYGEWSTQRMSWKWQKLTTAAEYYNYRWPSAAHNSLSDCLATLYVYNCMKDKGKRPRPLESFEVVEMLEMLRDSMRKTGHEKIVGVDGIKYESAIFVLNEAIKLIRYYNLN